MSDQQAGDSGARSRRSRGANRHDIVDGRYPGAELYDVLEARCGRLEADLEAARGEIETLRMFCDSDEFNVFERLRQKDQSDLAQARALLKRVSDWDHMDTAADGPYWRAEIAKVLHD